MTSSPHKTRWKTEHLTKCAQWQDPDYHSYRRPMHQNFTFRCCITSSSTGYGHMRTLKSYRQQTWANYPTTSEATCQISKPTFSTDLLLNNALPVRDTFWTSMWPIGRSSCWKCLMIRRLYIRSRSSILSFKSITTLRGLLRSRRMMRMDTLKSSDSINEWFLFWA